MGIGRFISCSSCDFKITNKNEIFSVKEGKLKEGIFGIRFRETFGKDPIYGYINTRYCANCNNLIKRYEINLDNTEYDKDEAIKIVSDLIKNKKYSTVGINSDETQKIPCHNCGSNLTYKLYELDKCPKCGGKLNVINVHYD